MADEVVTTTVTVEGLDELEESLIAGGPRVAKAFLRKVQSKVARILRQHLSDEAPYESGELSEDIHIQNVLTDGALTTHIGPSKRTFWGYIQEFGAPEANVPAQHWAEMTAIRHEEETRDNYIKVMTESLQEMKK